MMRSTFSMEDMVPRQNTIIAMTNLGYIKRMTVDNFKAQNRGGKGIKGMQTIEDDFIADLLMTTTHHYVMFFTNYGRVYRLKAYEIPEAGRTARGICHHQPASAFSRRENIGHHSGEGLRG